MKAVQLVAHGSPGRFVFVDLPDPVAAADEAVVRVHACGLNRLDLWAEQGELPIRIALPRVLGCEVAGEITAVGSDIADFRSGDRVTVQSNLFCGACAFCLAGEESLCLKGELLGIQRDGGFEEEIAVPARSLVRLPEKVSFETAAALTLAGSTAMHMLTHRAPVTSGKWVLVMAGASGVGSAAIQIARSLGAYVIATASSEPKRELASKLGAQYLVDSTRDDWPAEVRRITEKRGVDVIVEHVGGPVLEKAFECLARGGTIVTCGATAGREVRLQLWPFFVKEHRLVGSYGRNREDLERTLEWAATGRLDPAIDRVFPLAETVQALSRLRDRLVLGKVLIKPG